MKNNKKVGDGVMGKWGNGVMRKWGDFSLPTSSYSLIPLFPYSLFLYQRSSLLRFIIGIFLILSIESCYEDREGCLDLRATNFDIDADRECDGCCVYPQLKLVFEHKLLPDSIANLTYETTVYKDGAGNDFRVKDIQFYVSNARLVREDGTEAIPKDSLNVNIQPPGGEARAQKVTDNVALINRNNFSPAEMGELITTGKFTKIRFTLGLKGVLNQVIPTSLPDSLVNHPLENTAMYVNVDTGFIFNKLQLFNSFSQTDTTFNTFRILSPDSVDIELPLDANIIEGFHIRVIIRINYLKWFAGVNLINDPPATVTTKITSNLRNSFSVTRVEMEGL